MRPSGSCCGRIAGGNATAAGLGEELTTKENGRRGDRGCLTHEQRGAMHQGAIWQPLSQPCGGSGQPGFPVCSWRNSSRSRPGPLLKSHRDDYRDQPVSLVVHLDRRHLRVANADPCDSRPGAREDWIARSMASPPLRVGRAARRWPDAGHDRVTLRGVHASVRFG